MVIGSRAALVVAVTALSSSAAFAQSPPASFRPYILKAIEQVHPDRAKGGYHLSKRFTKDLNYSGDCCLKASRPLSSTGKNQTMCVAAVAEVMVEALNLWGKEKGASFKSELPLSRWSGGTRQHLIPNLFLFKGTDSLGTAWTLQRFGMGKERPFDQLKAGDFINFNRLNKSGHAVIFLGFLRQGNTQPTETFAPDVVGFRYFSAQGKGRPDGGLGYRNAYFDKKCPTPRGRDDDCGIIGISVGPNGKVAQSRTLFNSGEMFSPSDWKVAQALVAIRSDVTRGFEEEGLTRGSGLEEAVNAVLNEELHFDEQLWEDGSGT